MYLNITISNDTVVEQQETFGVRLSATDQSVSLTQDEATVIISDDTGTIMHPWTFKQAHMQSILWHLNTVHVQILCTPN